MIIPKDLIGSANKEKLVYLANLYSSKFVNKLGLDIEIKINPEELIFDKKEAKKIIKSKKFPKIINQYFMMNVNDRSAFVYDGIAFIPISNLSIKEKGLISLIQNDSTNKLFNFLNALIRYNDYYSLDGFYSEIGHLIEKRLFCDREYAGGLGEAMDMASCLYGGSLDLQLLGQIYNKNEAFISILKSKLSNIFIKDLKERNELLEIILFNNKKEAKKRLSKKFGIDTNDILRWLTKDYILTKHFDGIKLFTEIYDSTSQDLDKTYLKLGILLSDPEVVNVKSALSKLNSNLDLSKYDGILDTDIFQRLKITK